MAAVSASLHSFMPLIMLLFFFSSPSLCKALLSPHSHHPHPQPLYLLISPSPSSGGDLPQLPSERFRAAGPSPSGSALDPFQPASGPAPSENPSGVPLINSNPAVPLPSDVADSASFLPLPSRGTDSQEVGKGALRQIHIFIIVLVMFFSFLASA